MIGNPVLRYLGFAATDRVVVIHADDLGMCQATLPAFVDVLAAGLVSSGSVMVPCPWFAQAIELLRACPTADVGLHMTLTSEWAAYRWGPLTTHDPATGLLDQDGYFPRDTFHLKQHFARTNHRHPLLRRAFAFSHAGFSRLLGDGLVGEQPDPNLAAALNKTRHRDTGGFNLPVGDPTAAHGFETVVAER